MADFRFSLSELVKGITLPTGESHTITLASSTRRVRLVGVFFDLNKCFLLPTAMPGIRTVKQQYDAHQGGHVLVVGHTDTAGKDAYNLSLSVERADATAAFLSDAAEAWEAFFGDDKPSEKRWGALEIQHMLTALPQGSSPFYAGTPNGAIDAQHKDAVKAFQKAHSLQPIDGIAGPNTRSDLIRAYMALDDTTLPAGINLATHGCGENFPVDETGDAVRSPENRRVEIFFFDGPIVPPPPAAPGNTSARGSTGYPQWLKQVEQTIDVTQGSVGTDLTLKLVSSDGFAIPDVAYTLSFEDGTSMEGRVDARGKAIVSNAPALGFTLQYADPDDMRAKVFAARMNQAVSSNDLKTMLGVLSQSHGALRDIAKAYDKYFNTLTGEGMGADAEQVARGTDSESATDYLMRAGGIAPKSGARPAPLFAYSEPSFQDADVAPAVPGVAVA